MRQYQSPYRLSTVDAVTVSGTSAQSAAFGTTLIRIASTTDCHFVIGDDPTATTDGHLLPAGVVEYLIVDAGDKLAAIQVSAGGTLTVSDATK